MRVSPFASVQSAQETGILPSFSRSSEGRLGTFHTLAAKSSEPAAKCRLVGSFEKEPCCSPSVLQHEMRSETACLDGAGVRVALSAKDGERDGGVELIQRGEMAAHHGAHHLAVWTERERRGVRCGLLELRGVSSMEKAAVRT